MKIILIIVTYTMGTIFGYNLCKNDKRNRKL